MNDTSEIAKTESSRSLLAAVIQSVPAALIILRFFMGLLSLFCHSGQGKIREEP